MIILTLRTDKPESEIGLYEDEKQLAYDAWEAHRQLAETLHKKMQKILSVKGLTLENISGVVVYKGPGSFTGLRIGLSVANALAYGQNIPIVAAGTDAWIEQGIARLIDGKTDKIALPEYGRDPNVTAPAK